MYKYFFKRQFDFIIALMGSIPSSPVLIMVTIGLFFSNNGKPFFFQFRPVKEKRIFKIVKFKTMNDIEVSNGNLLPDAQRLTKIGAFVQKTSLDEFPQ